MDNTASEVDKKNMESTDTLISTEDSKMKCYESNDENYVLEISEDEKEKSKNKESIGITNSQKVDNNKFDNGEIIVTSVLDFNKNWG